MSGLEIILSSAAALASIISAIAASFSASAARKASAHAHSISRHQEALSLSRIRSEAGSEIELAKARTLHLKDMERSYYAGTNTLFSSYCEATMKRIDEDLVRLDEAKSCLDGVPDSYEVLVGASERELGDFYAACINTRSFAMSAQRKIDDRVCELRAWSERPKSNT